MSLQRRSDTTRRAIFFRSGVGNTAGGKSVVIFAVREWQPQRLLSNTFTLEWPPQSGQLQKSEVDRAAWFSIRRRRNQKSSRVSLSSSTALSRTCADFPRESYHGPAGSNFCSDWRYPTSLVEPHKPAVGKACTKALVGYLQSLQETEPAGP